MRRLLSQLLLALAAVGLTLAAVLTVANESLVDAQAFGRRSAQSLGDPRVADFAADRLTDAVLAARPDLTPVRPLILATSRMIVPSEAFRAVFRTAAESVHRALFSEGTQRIVLSVPDVGVLVRSAVERASPELAQKLPTELEARVLSLESSPALRLLEQAWALGEILRTLTQVLLVLSPILLVIAIWLARDVRRGFVVAGAALCVSGMATWALLPLGRALAPVLLDTPLDIGAAEGLWDAVFSPLGNWALFLLGLGLLLIAAGTSLMTRFEPVSLLRIAGERLLTPPPTRAGRLLWGIVLIFSGVGAVQAPIFVARAAVVALGLAVVFLGGRALFGLVLESVESSEVAVRVGDAGRSMLNTAALVGLVVGVGGIWVALKWPAPEPAPHVIDVCNGHTVLCGRRVEHVSFPGTHNAMSSTSIADWMFPQQQAGIGTQLGDGVRALLIDVHYGYPGGSRIKTDLSGRRPTQEAMEAVLGREGVDAALRIRDRLVGVDEGSRGLYLCHGFCELGATELATTLHDIRDFLVRRPGEVLLVVVEDYVTPRDLADAFEATGLSARVYRGPSGPPWPTLRDLVASGSNLVVFLESGSGGVEWLRPAFELIQETPYTFRAPDEFSCRPNRGPPNAGLFQINHWIETTPTPLPSNAEIVNARKVLLGRARECEQARGMLPNILAVDFYRTGDLFSVVDELNGVSGAEGR